MHRSGKLKNTSRGVLLCGFLACSMAARAQVVAPPAAEEAASDDVSVSERQFVRDVRADLVAEHFDKLDRLADSLRRGKDRWVGGGWKLNTLYGALDFRTQRTRIWRDTSSTCITR